MTWIDASITPEGSWWTYNAQLELFDDGFGKILSSGAANPIRGPWTQASILRWARRNIRLPGHRIQWKLTSTATWGVEGGFILVPATQVRG